MKRFTYWVLILILGLAGALFIVPVVSKKAVAERIEQAVGKVLDQGLRTADIMAAGMTQVGTREMGAAVVAALAD